MVFFGRNCGGNLHSYLNERRYDLRFTFLLLKPSLLLISFLWLCTVAVPMLSVLAISLLVFPFLMRFAI